MSDSGSISRRTLLKSGGAVAAAAPMLVSSSVWGANDSVGIGLIGPGRRGNELVRDFSRHDSARFVAVTDPNERYMLRAAAQTGWKQYKDFRDLLEDSDVDAVIVATPDHWHALHSIYACMAGKDVYVEKPMTLTVAEGRAMVDAARKFERVVQCGSQQRSMRQCRIGCAIVRSGLLGEIHTVHAHNYPSPWDQPFPEQTVPQGLDWDFWVGPTPMRPYHIDLYTARANPGWISIMQFSGGEATGWGSHGLDLIQWALGMDDSGPVEIWAEGSFQDLNRKVNMRYANGVLLTLDNQGPMGGGRFDGENGSLVVDRGRYSTDPEELGQIDEGDLSVQLPVSQDHAGNFLDCVRSRELPICDVEIGHRSSTVCHMVNIARWANRELKWDPVAERFIDDDDANGYLDRPRRSPWELPEI